MPCMFSGNKWCYYQSVRVTEVFIFSKFHFEDYYTEGWSEHFSNRSTLSVLNGMEFQGSRM